MLELEEKNADFWLETVTKPKLIKIVEKQIITNHGEEVVDKQTGCVQMFNQKRLTELSLLYRIFKRDEDSLKHIINKMNPYIEERGEKITKDESLLKDPVAFTKKLLDLKAEKDNMVEDSFGNDMKF